MRVICFLIILPFLQLQHDYVLGNYPVGRDDAAQLSALQILVEIGYVVSPETCTLVSYYVSLSALSVISYIFHSICSFLF